MSDDIKISDFNTICRICLNSINSTLPISLNDIKTMLTECTSITISDETNNLPDKICDCCHNNLKIAFNLRELSIRSEIRLQSILEAPSILKSEVEVIDEIPENCDSDDSDYEKKHLKGFECEICLDVLDNKIDVIDNHMQDVHSQKSHKEELKLVCETCNKVFTKRYKFNKHKLSHNNERPFQCNDCDSNYKTVWSLRHHIASVHTKTIKTVMCDTCGKSIRETSLQSHLRTHIKKEEHICRFCDKVLFSEKTLLEHVRVRHEKKPRKYSILCNICGIGIKSKGTLKDHLLVHTREKPYQCEKCDKRYRTKAALSGHVARAHLDLRNHICKHCSKGFYDRVILENHMRTHTGERPFQCQVCQKSFSFQAALRTHMKVHDKI